MTISTDKTSARQHGGHSIPWFWVMGLAAALLVLVGLSLFGAFKSTDVARPAGHVVVLPPQPLPSKEPVVPTVVPSSLTVTGRLLRSGSGPRPIPMPPEVRDALQLGASATMREALPIERGTDVVCGEVSPDGSGRRFQRFVYIGVAKTGKVDDGTPELKRYFELVCVQQPDP